VRYRQEMDEYQTNLAKRYRVERQKAVDEQEPEARTAAASAAPNLRTEGFDATRASDPSLLSFPGGFQPSPSLQPEISAEDINLYLAQLGRCISGQQHLPEAPSLLDQLSTLAGGSQQQVMRSHMPGNQAYLLSLHPSLPSQNPMSSNQLANSSSVAHLNYLLGGSQMPSYADWTSFLSLHGIAGLGTYPLYAANAATSALSQPHPLTLESQYLDPGAAGGASSSPNDTQISLFQQLLLYSALAGRGSSSYQQGGTSGQPGSYWDQDGHQKTNRN